MKQAPTTILHRGIVGALRRTALAVALGLSVSAAALAQDAGSAAFDIPQQPLPAALRAFAEQSGMQLLYRPETFKGATSRAISGKIDRRQALQMLLADSGLEAVYSAENAATIRPRTREPSTKEGYPGAVTGTGDVSGQATTSSTAEAADPGNPAAEDGRPEVLDTITVTGTRIRGGTTPSPVLTIGSERIREEGFADLGEVVRSVSQNYGGGQNPGITTGVASGGGNNNLNVTGGSGVNLRGLGQDATLTLLNGRRMSYGGYAQTVDISAIPVDAVDRLEIVTDGASAIYGSDAVGGVANVILRRDFEGVAVGMRHGGASDGGLATHEYTATAGAVWSTGGLVATWKKASNDPIYSRQRDYTQGMYDHTTLYQGGDLRSGLLSARQSLGDSVELHLDALRSERSFFRDTGYSTTYYHYPNEVTTSLISPGATVSLPGDWTLSAGAAVGKDVTASHMQAVARATGATSDTSYGFENNSRTYEVGAEGPLFALPGGDTRVAVGAGYRYNDFLYSYGTGVIADGDEGSRFAYAELVLPLLGPDQGIAGVNRLEVTGAVRSEDYDSYGRVVTPKIGMIFSPSPDFTLKASWGESFKTPTLYQRFIASYSYLYPATTFGGDGGASGATVLYRNGGNPGLEPERARTWSASLVFHPEAFPGMTTELTWFHIDYDERIALPIASSGQALVSPIYDDFIHYSPTAEEQAGVIEDSTAFVNYTGGSYDPGNVLAIIDNTYANVSRQRIRGADLSGSYRFDIGAGRLTVRGSVSWLGSEQALTSASGYSDMAGNLFYPAKVSGRLGTVWSNGGGLTASLFGNYRSGVENTVDGSKNASFTTLDTTFRYEAGSGEGAFSGMTFEISAQNLLDRAPPLYAATSLANAPYDSTNYSATGRFVSVSLSKRW